MSGPQTTFRGCCFLQTPAAGGNGPSWFSSPAQVLLWDESSCFMHFNRKNVKYGSGEVPISCRSAPMLCTSETKVVFQCMRNEIMLLLFRVIKRTCGEPHCGPW